MKAKKFDQKFDAGRDVTGDVDLTRARRAGVDSASDDPIAMPSSSRTPSAFTATAINTALETRPASRPFT
jgi:hypothetical protein